MFQDHDAISGSIGNLRVLDNTNYPHTHDVEKVFTKSDEKTSQFIIGFTEDKDAVKFKMIIYHNPLDFTCPCQSENK